MKGKITITRPSYSDSRRAISITMHDESSGTQFLDVEIGMAEFAEAITGMSRIPCEFQLFARNVGKIHEHKAVSVFVPAQRHKTTPEIVRAAVAEHEVDGWMARDDDAKNGHRITSYADDGYHVNVTYDRFVEPVEEQP
jgi:hypothetical protein